MKAARSATERLALARLRARSYARAAFISANLAAAPHPPFIRAAAKYLAIVRALEQPQAMPCLLQS